MDGKPIKRPRGRPRTDKLDRLRKLQDDNPNLTVKEIAAIMGVTRHRIYQMRAELAAVKENQPQGESWLAW